MLEELLVALIVLFTAPAYGNQLARGFNEDIDWVDLEKGFTLSKELNKPVMLLIHKSWCGACKNLKPGFTANKKIEELSNSFVMINVQDDEEPSDIKYRPDGGYIPRILFFSPLGNLLSDVKNPNGNDNYKYYYPNADNIVVSMKRVLGLDFSDESKSEL